MSDYGSQIGIALPGTIADSGDYNIDGCCFVEEFAHEISAADSRQSRMGEIQCGKIVHVSRIVDGYKEISSVFDDNSRYDIAYGVALRDSFGYKIDESGLIGYLPGSPISVVTHGRVWALTTQIRSAPEPFTRVFVSEDGYAQDEGANEINWWSFTGGFAKLSDVFHLVEIQVKQSAGHMTEHKFIKVNGIHLIKSVDGNLKYNTPFRVSAEVSPKDATDKTGHWTVDDPAKGTIQVLNDSQIEFTPTRSFIGDVHITWTANDGSGVQGMVEVTYIP